MGLSNELSCEAGSFSHHCNSHRFLQPENLRLSFPGLQPWVACSVSISSCSSQLIQIQTWDFPACQPLPCLPQSSSHCLAVCPTCPGCPPVWGTVPSMGNVAQPPLRKASGEQGWWAGLTSMHKFSSGKSGLHCILTAMRLALAKTPSP